jgi:hypothetical protein
MAILRTKEGEAWKRMCAATVELRKASLRRAGIVAESWTYQISWWASSRQSIRQTSESVIYPTNHGMDLNRSTVFGSRLKITDELLVSLLPGFSSLLPGFSSAFSG